MSEKGLLNINQVVENNNHLSITDLFQNILLSPKQSLRMIFTKKLSDILTNFRSAFNPGA